MTKSIPLKRIARMRYGSALPEAQRRGGTVAVYGSAGPVAWHDAPNTDGPVIIIGRKGSFGKVSYSTEPVFVIDTAFFIDSSCTNADLRWLKYVIEAAGLDQLSQDVGVPGLSREAAYTSPVTVTPAHAQRQIAAFLDRETATVDILIDRKRRLLALLEEKRLAIVRAAVSGRLTSADADRRDSGLAWLTTLPTHWSTVKLSLVAKLGTGHTPRRSQSRFWEGDRNIPWLTTSDIQKFRDDHCEILTTTKESITKVGLENSSAELHPAGTVALSRTASVGFSVIMGKEMATSQDFVTWTCSKKLDPNFLLYCLRTMRTDLQERLAIGSTHTTIYMPVIQGLRVPLPTIEEQRKAVEAARSAIGNIDRLTNLISQQIPLLEERRKALITAAVTGELNPAYQRTSAVAA